MSENLVKKLSNVNSSDLLGVVAARDLLTSANWQPTEGGTRFKATISFPKGGDDRAMVNALEILSEAGGYNATHHGFTSNISVAASVKEKLDQLLMIHDTGKSLAVN